jgi:hypothetical protein
VSGLPDLIKAYLGASGELTEGRVLSGDGFFIDGRLRAAVIDGDLCVHVGGESWGSALAMPEVRPLMFAGRPVKGWVLVTAGSISDEGDLAVWVDNALGP